MTALTKNNPSNIYYDFYKKMFEKKWFYFNIKFCGVIFILLGSTLLFYIIYQIIK